MLDNLQTFQLKTMSLQCCKLQKLTEQTSYIMQLRLLDRVKLLLLLVPEKSLISDLFCILFHPIPTQLKYQH